MRWMTLQRKAVLVLAAALAMLPPLLVAARAAALKRRVGLRADRFEDGGGLPKRVRKAVRRDAVLNLVRPGADSASLKPSCAEEVPDATWQAGVGRLLCGARADRFELLRRLTVANMSFVASMPGAAAGSVPEAAGNWWRCSVARGWQLKLTGGELVIAGGRAKWRGGGYGGGGRHVVAATSLIPQGAGFVLGEEITVSQDMVREAGVFVDWHAADSAFVARDPPVMYSMETAPAPVISEQALPPLPQDHDSAVGADRLDVLVVLPQAALAACAAEGHSPTKCGQSDVMWVLDEPVPRAIRKAFYHCVACRDAPRGPDGERLRRFRKVPTLADVNQYFPKMEGMDAVFLAGQTYYTIWFLIVLASHFVLRPQITELKTWLAERWGLATVGVAFSGCAVGRAERPDRVEEIGAAEVPWILDALRGHDVLVGLVERFVNCFLDGLCEKIESEAWLADGAIFGADVCVKLAKVVVNSVRVPSRKGGKTRAVRLYTGVLLHVGARGMLLSVPELIRQETNRAYKLSLKPKLARLRRQASALGMPSCGLPVGAFVDTLGFEAGLKEAVAEEFHGVVDCGDPRRLLSDGFQVGKDGNHLNWHFEKYAPKHSCDFHLGSDCHRDMIARHNNPDRPGSARREYPGGPWQAVGALAVHLRALLDRWAGAARKYLREAVAGQPSEKLLREFAQRADVVIHPVWERVFPEAAANRTVKRKGAVKVPRVFVERLAHLLDVALHEATPAWGYACEQEWTEEVDCFRAYFSTAVYTVGPPSWSQDARDHVRESEEEPRAAAGRQVALVTPVVNKHLDNLLTPRIRRGLQVGRELALVCAQAGVQKASGTTDIDALCHELEILLLRRCVTTVSPERARMI
ncbi:unnamed protein product, partial [Prorocentrum cordatum]